MEKQNCILNFGLNFKFFSLSFGHKMTLFHTFISFYLLFLVGQSYQQLQGHFGILKLLFTCLMALGESLRDSRKKI